MPKRAKKKGYLPLIKETGSLTILACPLGLIAHMNKNRLYMGGVNVVNPGMGNG
jgi:hypothetical protein